MINAELTLLRKRDSIQEQCQPSRFTYHKLGEIKYERLEIPNKSVSIEPPSEEHMSELKKIVEPFGLTVYIGR